jgi:hypothetical protein
VSNPIASSALRISAKTVGVVYCLLGAVLVTILPVVGLVQLLGNGPTGRLP